MSARSLTDFIFRQAARKWIEEGWMMRVDLRESKIVAETLDDDQVVVLYPHGPKDLPVERSVWHELLHVLFPDEEEEPRILRMEQDTWPLLSRGAKANLRRMVQDVTGQAEEARS